LNNNEIDIMQKCRSRWGPEIVRMGSASEHKIQQSFFENKTFNLNIDY